MGAGISSGLSGEMPVSGKAPSGGSTSKEASGQGGSAGHEATSRGLGRGYSQAVCRSVILGMCCALANGVRRRLAAFRRGL